jgi:hypothetical protein
MKLAIVSIIVGCALVFLGGWAILLPSLLLANSVMCVVTATLAASVVGAIACSGRSTAFWRGFSIFGIAYLILPTLSGSAWGVVWPTLDTSEKFPPTVLSTTCALASAYDYLGMPEVWTSGGTRVPAPFLLRLAPSQVPEDLIVAEFEEFMKVGQCLVAVLVGLVGGWMGVWLHHVDTSSIGKTYAAG